MKIYTMGFKGKSQEEFIKTINKKKIELVVDMRERNRFPEPFPVVSSRWWQLPED